MSFVRGAFVTAISLFAVLSWADPMAVVSVKLSPTGSFKAETKDVKGAATIKGAEINASNVTVDLKSLNSGVGLRDEHMKNKYLDVKKFPDAVLVMGKGKDGKGTGKIKIKGITKDISGTYKMRGQEVEANFDLKLSEFGITGIKYMGIGVNDLVQVSVVVPAKK